MYAQERTEIKKKLPFSAKRSTSGGDIGRQNAGVG
jgi:hypothetical protein